MISVTTYAIVFFVLLLALAIVACVFWLEKRSGHTIKGVQAYDEILRVEGEQDEKSKGVFAHGEIVQGGGKPCSYYTRNARPFRRIALYVPIQNENAPNTDALISTAKGIELDTVKTDALVMRAQEMDMGANFRIRRKIFLPSTPVVETAKSGESPVGSSLGRRSTGLLSRYGEIQQE